MPRQDWNAILGLSPQADWGTVLDEHSNLPGPRGNLELLEAFATHASAPIAIEFARSPDEYRAACGTAALGPTALGSIVPGPTGTDPTVDGPLNPRHVELLRQAAMDDRWRVRESVAIALQLLGDRSFGRMLEIIAAWADDPDPLVQRARIAAICEPRLIRHPDAAVEAVRVCRQATEVLLALPTSERRSPGARTLRQALGYCWSVAVAADPVPGLAAFDAFARAEDPDVDWIVRENKKKKRLARLLD